MTMKQMMLPLIAAIALAGCHSQKDTMQSNAASPAPSVAPAVQPQRALPRAIVYRTSQPSADLVPVAMNSDGKTLASYPAVTDVSAATSTPIQLGDGWMLDRRGIGPDAAFTGYTYADYAALKTTPSPAELIESIRPAIRVTDMYSLPITANEAIADPSLCKPFIASGFAGCRRIGGKGIISIAK